MNRLKLLGSRRRTQVLMTVALLKETYAAELARVLKAPLYSVQKVLLALEEEDVLAGRTIGRERRYSLNPRFYASQELATLLAKLAEIDFEVQAAASSLRRRPRKPRKPL